MAGLYTNYLFKVTAIKSNKHYCVYGIKSSKPDDIEFLFYEDDRWFWASASLFKPSISG